MLLVTVLCILNFITGLGTYGSITAEETSGTIEFEDIIAHWAKQEIMLMVKMGITKGVDSKHYEPESNITKAEFLTMVMRGIKMEEAPYDGAYSDVNASDWFAGIVQAAADSGIIDNGMMQNGNFGPNTAINRQEMTSIVVNAYTHTTGKSVVGASIEFFEDYNQISDWAVPYVQSANELGIIKGLTPTQFAPYQNATRAQAAVIIKRLLTAAGLITVEEEPVNFLTSQSLGMVKNDYSGWAGVKITVGSLPLKVTDLGRLVITGNTQAHKIKIVDAASGSDVADGEASVEMAGGSEGQFVYTKLNAPVVLNANTSYYIVSQETEGGDKWGDSDTQATAEVARIDNAVRLGQSGQWENIGSQGEMFIPVDFKCIAVSTGTTGVSATPVPSGTTTSQPVPTPSAQPGNSKEYISHASLISSKGETEEFDFNFWIPENIKVVKGVYVVITHGYGGKLVQNNAFRDMLRRTDCALVYFYDEELKGFSDQMMCGNIVLNALKDFAVQSGHPELENAPLATWGHSNGAAFAARFAAWKPERFFSVTAYKSAFGKQFELPELKDIPTQVIVGELDNQYGDNGQDISVQNMRGMGALVHFAVDKGAGHGPNQDKSNSFCIPFMEKAFKLRVPADADTTKGPVKLNAIDETSGWLGNPETKEIAPYSSYSGDKKTASWFFDETFANQWKEFVTTGEVQGIPVN